MAGAFPVLYGKYQLLDLLARGGMAEVFKAKSHGVEGFEKILVIKRILPELSQNPRFVEMFINEAKIAVTLSHANIVQVFDLGRAEDSFFIAMELVAGLDLATILQRAALHGAPMPQELAVFVVSELAKGLDYAHRRRDSNLKPLQIVHRDVSPQNVLLSFEGEVKLTDFGIARARTSFDESDHGVVKGKYAYMSPEQANGLTVDARSDLYALGIVLFECLAGQNPCDAGSPYETQRRVRNEAVPPIRSVCPGVPEELASIVDRSLAWDPSERHANAGRLYEELVQFLYSSGRRVGGHDLAAYLQALREAGAAGEFERDAARLRADFATEGRRQASNPDKTPVEVPSGRARGRNSVRASGDVDAPRRAVTGVALPNEEQRELTVLVVRSSDGRGLPRERIERAAERFGGVPCDGVSQGPASAWLFGAGDSEERDTDAAARCALRLARPMGLEADGEPRLATALHSGHALLDLRGQLLSGPALDALVSEADALCRRATPGQPLVSAAVRKSLSASFRTAPLGDGSGAGILVTEEASAHEASGRFVGRKDELRQIGEFLALANRGKVKVLSVAGEAGSGKTRLILETRRRLKLGGHDVGIHIATCPRHTRAMPYSGMQEMLRVVLGFEELDADESALPKVQRLRELGLAQPDVSAISALLGLETSEGVSPSGPLLRSAVGRMAMKLAQDRLTVFAFDSAESLDAESFALLESLVLDGRRARIAVVLAHRPGVAFAWRDAAVAKHEIDLGHLSDDEVSKLVAARLSADEVPPELVRDVAVKSGGNPLYAEEYVKALLDTGAVEITPGGVEYRAEVADVGVPKTLRGLVGARLARVGVADRQLLQIASVAGPRFSVDLLARVTAEEAAAVLGSLTVLEGRGLIVRAGMSDFSFAHELFGEVVREGLTLEARRAIHGAVAAALEALYPQRLDELAERLAAHWREAGDRVRSVDCLVRAGERLASEFATESASRMFEKAIEVLAQLPVPDRDRMLALYRRVGEICWKGRALEHGASRMLRAVELAEGLEQDGWVARFALMRGRLLVAAHRVEEGRKWLARAEGIALRLADSVLERDITLARAEGSMRLGQHRDAIAAFEHARALSVRLSDTDAQVRCLVPLALAYASLGDRAIALDGLTDARRLAGERLDPFTECELLKMESLVHYFSRDYEATVDTAARARDLAKEYGLVHEAAVNAHNIGDALVRLGDSKRAFASLRYSFELSRDHGFDSLMMSNLRILGFIDAMRFGSDEGRRHVVQANEFDAAKGYVWHLLQGRYYLAMIDQARGMTEDSRTGLRELLRMAAEHGHARYVETAHRALARLDAGLPLGFDEA